MIFMDIIMPKLDGVSTTMYIRQDCPAIPIVAMTSNIRSDEVHCYFEHGKCSRSMSRERTWELILHVQA